ncbi:apolipoprotein L3-like isoform X2 [Camelus ferus]|uniref:Apolipoprotein L3-like isoform X2 n=1 Tax=Camelus ferus TaxID=419612 RepID=A0A8B8U1N0_CAMFR|nr:apolipoprotein L3-like isoform X2 [Camelus ferus]
MTSIGLLYCLDKEWFFEAVIECLWDILNREELLRLLTAVLDRIEDEENLSRSDQHPRVYFPQRSGLTSHDPEAHHASPWQTVSGQGPRGESAALRECLDDLKTLLALKVKYSLLKEQLNRKRFLKKFPHMKRELEESIGKLRALADKVDKVHRDCTISQVAAASAGVASGILTILGLALAPVTAGVSLALSATGLGLGAASAVTSVATSVVERVVMSSAETEANDLMLTAINRWKMVKEVLLQSGHKIVSAAQKLVEAVQQIEKNIRAIEVLRANPGLAGDVQRFLTTGQISVQSGKQVQEVLKGTALAMSTGARAFGMATAGFSLLWNVGFLMKDSLHLHEGAKAESAEWLRQRARELESRLEELTRTYENLL